MSLATYSERILNGEPIDWAYWAVLKNITPHQAAKLANRIDPIKWLNNKCALGEIPEDIQILIRSLEQHLENQKSKFNLHELTQYLGNDCPEGMLEQVSNKNIDNSNNKYVPRVGGYKERDEIAIKEVEIRPELLKMRPCEIKAYLSKKDSAIFISGYDDWWRQNPIFPKGKPGKIPK